MAFSNAYTIGFAVTICVVCSTTLAGIAMGLKDMQDDNRRRDLYKNILSAVDLPAADADGNRASLSGDAVDQLWEEKIELKAIDPASGAPIDASKADVNGDGTFNYLDLAVANAKVKNTENPPEILGLYVRKDTGAIAIPMTGKGLWGPISAYIAFDTKLEKVTGTTFFAPKETPGLGAEITAPIFMAQWPGKSIVENGNTVPIRVLKPAECDEGGNPHCVDGVSGATITSRGVDVMVEKSLALYEPYIQKVRQ